MSVLAAYQSACQPQGPPPVHTRTKDGDSLKVCTLLWAVINFVAKYAHIKYKSEAITKSVL